MNRAKTTAETLALLDKKFPFVKSVLCKVTVEMDIGLQCAKKKKVSGDGDHCQMGSWALLLRLVGPQPPARGEALKKLCPG